MPTETDSIFAFLRKIKLFACITWFFIILLSYIKFYFNKTQKFHKSLDRLVIWLKPGESILGIKIINQTCRKFGNATKTKCIKAISRSPLRKGYPSGNPSCFSNIPLTPLNSLCEVHKKIFNLFFLTIKRWLVFLK